MFVSKNILYLLLLSSPIKTAKHPRFLPKASEIQFLLQLILILKNYGQQKWVEIFWVTTNPRTKLILSKKIKITAGRISSAIKMRINALINRQIKKPAKTPSLQHMKYVPTVRRLA